MIKCEMVGLLDGVEYQKTLDADRRVYDENGLCPTVRVVTGGNKELKVITRNPVIAAMRGRNPDNPTSRTSGEHTEQMLEYKDDGTSNALTTVQKDDLVIEPSGYVMSRIRKLTPLECWRLMDFDDEDYYKAKASGTSNSQLYKQAGNSIVVSVLEAIFRQMLLVAEGGQCR